MAVYTHVSAEELAAFLARYDVGDLVSAKGIAEGVENSNYLVETTRARFILTLYEKRVEEGDLPYFLSLTGHLADKGLPVPKPIADRDGTALQQLSGRPACLIEFLPGVSVDRPTPAQARAAGRLLARIHVAAEDFPGERENGLSLDGWADLLADVEAEPADLDRALLAEARAAFDDISDRWPRDGLTRGTIHADLFPDNALFLGDELTGAIDFYFACTDVLAYDLAVAHTAWCFSADGTDFDADVGEALLSGYADGRPLGGEERAAFNLLCQGACLRFLLTRAYDWVHTPPDAAVTRKDPAAYLNRLRHYRDAE